MKDKKVEFRKDTSELILTAAQKDFLVTQLYLLTENQIQASTLDSLFQKNLHREGIPVHTAVLYQAQFGEKVVKEYSRIDSTYYRSALALPPVNLGLKQLNFEVYIQGFIKFPILYILRKIPHIGIILFAYLVGAIFMIWGIIGLRKTRRQAILIAERVEPKKNPAEIRFADSYMINKNTGEIKKEDVFIGQLSQYRLELFLLLLKGTDCFQDYDTIRSQIWKNTLTSKETINKTIVRLREDLNNLSIPLSIENVRTQGYRLIKQ